MTGGRKERTMSNNERMAAVSKESAVSKKIKELALRARAGDKVARDKIIEMNIALAANCASAYAQKDSELWDEMYAEALRWIVYSADKYDPQKHDCCFSTFASHWIRQGLARLSRKLNGTRIVTKRFYDETGKPRRKYSVKQEITQSLDENFKLENSEEGDNHASLMEDESAEAPHISLLRSEMLEKVQQALSVLNERERFIVENLFGLGGKEERTAAELAEELGVTTIRLYQIKQRALKKMAPYLEGYQELLE